MPTEAEHEERGAWGILAVASRDARVLVRVVVTTVEIPLTFAITPKCDWVHTPCMKCGPSDEVCNRKSVLLRARDVSESAYPENLIRIAIHHALNGLSVGLMK